MKVHLKKAIIHKGNELHTLDIPLEDLTGNDLIDVEEQILKTGNPIQSTDFSIQSTDFSRVYLISVAARALHMPVEILKQMGAYDFARVVSEVRNFLTLSDSEEELTEETANPPATS